MKKFFLILSYSFVTIACGHRSESADPQVYTYQAKTDPFCSGLIFIDKDNIGWLKPINLDPVYNTSTNVKVSFTYTGETDNTCGGFVGNPKKIKIISIKTLQTMKKLILLLVLAPYLLYSQYIIGGNATNINEVPYQVSLQVNGSHICGGSILNDKQIITAAHCAKYSANSYQVKTGLTLLNSPTNNSGTYNVEQIIVHPQYNSSTSDNDIALIKVSGNIIFNSDTKSIPIATQSDNLYNEGQNTTVSGWGWTTAGSSTVSNQLNKVSVPIISTQTANNLLANSFPQHPVLTANMIATSPLSNDRLGPCHGDSGGPLVAKNSDGITKLIGAVSWGVPNCNGGSNSPSIYAKVINYSDWISQYAPIQNFSISGPSSICYSGAIYSINNLPPAYSVQWSSQPANALIIATPNASQTSVNFNGTNDATLVATVMGNGNTYTLQKNITRIASAPRMQINEPSGTCVTPYSNRTFTAVASNGESMENVQKVEWEVIDYKTNQPISFSTQTVNGVINGSISFLIPGHGQDYVIGIVQRSLDKCGNYSDWGPGNYLMVRNTCTGGGGYYLKVSPNPATSEIKVSVPDEAKAEALLKATVDRLNGVTLKSSYNAKPINKTLQVHDSRGVKLLEKKYIGDDYQLNVSSLPTGAYIIRVNDGETTYAQKFIKK